MQNEVHRTGRELVSPELAASLAAFAVAELGAPAQYADRIVDQALAFLATVAEQEGRPLVPSAAVDFGVHAFVLHTRDYSEWCERFAGRFIHHNPRPERGGRERADLGRTIEAMEDAGFAVDLKVWAETPGGLMQCDSDDGRPYGV
ncbi:glycine-rich domain-containing protein [Kitasatospora sp. NPDC001574]